MIWSFILASGIGNLVNSDWTMNSVSSDSDSSDSKPIPPPLDGYIQSYTNKKKKDKVILLSIKL